MLKGSSIFAISVAMLDFPVLVLGVSGEKSLVREINPNIWLSCWYDKSKHLSHQTLKVKLPPYNQFILLEIPFITTMDSLVGACRSRIGSMKFC